MVKRNISFDERKKEIITKTWTLDERKSLYHEFLIKKTLILWISGRKRDHFQRRKLVERSFLSIYKTCMIF